MLESLKFELNQKNAVCVFGVFTKGVFEENDLQISQIALRRNSTSGRYFVLGQQPTRSTYIRNFRSSFRSHKQTKYSSEVFMPDLCLYISFNRTYRSKRRHLLAGEDYQLNTKRFVTTVSTTEILCIDQFETKSTLFPAIQQIEKESR